MPHDRKIATCCYCGRRTVLELTARGGHELACGSCGAPLARRRFFSAVGFLGNPALACAALKLCKDV